VDTFEYNDSKPLLQLAQVQNLPVVVILCSAILGFSLSVLIFMDQNIGAAIVNNPANKYLLLNFERDNSAFKIGRIIGVIVY
jgi:hypothetical protein